MEIYFKNAKSEVVTQDNFNALTVEISWNNNVCKSRLVNNSDKAVSVKEVVLFRFSTPFDSNTQVFGEAYNMLSQYSGTVADFKHTGSFDERTHYRLPAAQGINTVYSFAIFYPENEPPTVFGFTSCRRFTGMIRFNKDITEIVLKLENITVNPGEALELEDFFADSGEKSALIDAYTGEINKNHPMRKTSHIPTGWCSWYYYGPNVSETDVYDNLEVIKNNNLDLKYIQIDDGYQAYMGDWLVPGNKFTDLKKLCIDIKEKGFEPAIWVAPFIAEKDSALFKNHPDWFVKDTDGTPLASDKVTFGGWRNGPWYMLDGSHPEALQYLKTVFTVMRNEWGVKYFKLDANTWGAMPFGKHYKENITCVEAYRTGMEAIASAVGDDSYILGCNAPMWASLGLVNGMRVTADIGRTWNSMRNLAKEAFTRNWQNGRLWINDPDTALLINKITTIVGPDGKPIETVGSVTNDEFMFHAAYILASGGVVFSGDNMAELSPEMIDVLRKLARPSGKEAEFNRNDYRVGRMSYGNKEILCVFNYEDETLNISIDVGGNKKITDFWSGDKLSVCENKLKMPPHSARVLVFE